MKDTKICEKSSYHLGSLYFYLWIYSVEAMSKGVLSSIVPAGSVKLDFMFTSCHGVTIDCHDKACVVCLGSMHSQHVFAFMWC